MHVRLAAACDFLGDLLLEPQLVALIVQQPETVIHLVGEPNKLVVLVDQGVPRQVHGLIRAGHLNGRHLLVHFGNLLIVIGALLDEFLLEGLTILDSRFKSLLVPRSLAELYQQSPGTRQLFMDLAFFNNEVNRIGSLQVFRFQQPERDFRA